MESTQMFRKCFLFVLSIAVNAKSSDLDCFIYFQKLTLLNVVVFSELESIKKVRIDNQLRWLVVTDNHQLYTGTGLWPRSTWVLKFFI